MKYKRNDCDYLLDILHQTRLIKKFLKNIKLKDFTKMKKNSMLFVEH